MKNGANPRYRIHIPYEETIDHPISWLPSPAPNEYLNRHNTVCQYLHWKICKRYGVPYAENWYKHQLENVTETDNVTILWDYGIQTNRKIKEDKQDIKKHLEQIPGTNTRKCNPCWNTKNSTGTANILIYVENQTMNNWSNVECICTDQKLINYAPHFYLHFIFTLFIPSIFLLYLLQFRMMTW